MPRPAYPRARPPFNPASNHSEEPAESEKLHKMLAGAGLGSRRDMEIYIATGRVTINGQLAQVGDRVNSNDVVRVDGRVVPLPWKSKLPRVVIYHKPEGEIVSRDDPKQRANVFDQLPRVKMGRWVSIGRLDYNTEGLLIFTTSGELANKLMHPRFEVEREYAVRVLGELTPEQLTTLRRGVPLEDGPARVERIEAEGGEGANKWYRLTILEGRNREVRRLFEALGLTVSRLIRVRFGPVDLPPRLKRGQRYELNEDEVARLLAWVDAGGKKAAKPQGNKPQANKTQANKTQAHKHQGAKSREDTPQAPRQPGAKPAGAGGPRRGRGSRGGEVNGNVASPKHPGGDAASLAEDQPRGPRPAKKPTHPFRRRHASRGKPPGEKPDSGE